MKEIKLGRSGLIAVVDDEDYNDLKKYNWRALKRSKNNIYVARTNDKGKLPKRLTMHRQILNLDDPKIFVDHKDGNGLNNCRNNIRIATVDQNNFNTRKASGCSSIYKGVSWLPCRNRWKAMIMFQGKSKQIGLFIDEADAARAYDKMAKMHFGEFAYLNFKQ